MLKLAFPLLSTEPVKGPALLNVVLCELPATCPFVETVAVIIPD